MEKSFHLNGISNPIKWKGAGNRAFSNINFGKETIMADVKYEKLDRIREDIKRDRAKVARLQEQIKVKEAKLKEAEANQIVADVGAMNMSPEQLAEFLTLIQSGGLHELLSGKTKMVTTVDSCEISEDENEDLYKDEEDENDED